MDTLTFIIKLVGPVFMVVWIGIMVNKKSVSKMVDEMTSSATAMFMGWLFSLLIWIILLLSSFWLNTISEAIISILWMLATLKWALLIILPKHMKKISKTMMKAMKDHMPVIWFLYLLIWLYLCWMWY